ERRSAFAADLLRSRCGSIPIRCARRTVDVLQQSIPFVDQPCTCECQRACRQPRPVPLRSRPRCLPGYLRTLRRNRHRIGLRQNRSPATLPSPTSRVPRALRSRELQVWSTHLEGRVSLTAAAASCRTESTTDPSRDPCREAVTIVRGC